MDKINIPNMFQVDNLCQFVFLFILYLLQINYVVTCTQIGKHVCHNRHPKVLLSGHIRCFFIVILYI